MTAPDFPCKTCGHLAEKHYSNVSTERGICILCINGDQYDRCAEFVPDNMKFLELKQKKQELLNE